MKIGNATAVIKQPNETINVTADVTVTALWTDRYYFTTAPSAISGLIYNREAQALVKAGEVSEGTVFYRLNATDEWSETIPTATNAGTYTVYYCILVGDTEYAKGNISALIAPKMVTEPSFSGLKDAYYIADPNTIATNGYVPSFFLYDDDAAIPSSEYTVTYSDNNGLGTATITVTDKEDGNYTVSGTATFEITDQHIHHFVYANCVASDTDNDGDVVLTLTDSTNMKWKDSDTEDITLTFTITKATNEWVTNPSIEGWRMTEEPSAPVYEALFGNDTVKVVYYPADGSEEDATETPPTAQGEYVMLVTVADTDNYDELVSTCEFTIENMRVTVMIGGWALPKLHYMDTNGTISTTQPEGGYAYFEDGVLTLNNFVYLTKKNDSYEGIRAENDLTLVLIGKNTINSYDKCGISVNGDLTVSGDGSLTVETKATGISVKDTLTVDCGNLTVTAGNACVEARDVLFLGGEIKLTVTNGEKVLKASGSITLGELVAVSSLKGATVQKIDGSYVFTNANGNTISELTLMWAAHDCIDEDAVDHVCDICGKEYPTCRDRDLDHACDACGGEMGYHADTNSDHVCEYGCGVAIDICADADLDHKCDYGCAKVFGECKGVATTVGGACKSAARKVKGVFTKKQ